MKSIYDVYHGINFHSIICYILQWIICTLNWYHFVLLIITRIIIILQPPYALLLFRLRAYRIARFLCNASAVLDIKCPRFITL